MDRYTNRKRHRETTKRKQATKTHDNWWWWWYFRCSCCLASKAVDNFRATLDYNPNPLCNGRRATPTHPTHGTLPSRPHSAPLKPPNHPEGIGTTPRSRSAEIPQVLVQWLPIVEYRSFISTSSRLLLTLSFIPSVSVSNLAIALATAFRKILVALASTRLAW